MNGSQVALNVYGSLTQKHCFKNMNSFYIVEQFEMYIKVEQWQVDCIVVVFYKYLQFITIYLSDLGKHILLSLHFAVTFSDDRFYDVCPSRRLPITNKTNVLYHHYGKLEKDEWRYLLLWYPPIIIDWCLWSWSLKSIYSFILKDWSIFSTAQVIKLRTLMTNFMFFGRVTS